jgi:hypothetical protein
MKWTLIVMLFSLNTLAQDYKESRCYKSYQRLTKSKQSRHLHNFYTLNSYGISYGIVDKSNYWERDIYTSVESNPKKNETLKYIVKKVQRKYPETSVDEIKKYFKESFLDGSLCEGFLGLRRKKVWQK